MLGPDEDGAEKYEQFLESLPEPAPNIVAILKPRNKAGSGRPMLIMARLEYDEISQPFDNEYVVRYAPFAVADDLLVRAMNAEGQLRVALKQLDLVIAAGQRLAKNCGKNHRREWDESVIAVLQPNQTLYGSGK